MFKNTVGKYLKGALGRISALMVLAFVAIVAYSMTTAEPVLAGSATFSGTVDSTDIEVRPFFTIYVTGCARTDYGGNLWGEETPFSVDVAGTYTVTVDDNPVFEFAAVFEDSFSGTCLGSSYVGGSYTVTLQVGQQYVLFGGSGYYGGGSYNVDISGPGNITIGVVDPDADGDGVPDSSDNCVNTPNADQTDTDSDGLGNVCDPTPNGDNDSDGVDNLSDNCPNDANADQADTDSDGLGNVCDPTPNGDNDSDGVDNLADNCPNDPNAGQEDTDSDGIGDACDLTPNGDDDSDGVDNPVDNCPLDANAGQEDTDTDGIGDVCDATPNGDDDADGIDNLADNCPATPNAGQEDADSDGIGDVCDAEDNLDTDEDGVQNFEDNCVAIPNADQSDVDRDGIGDVCDPINDFDLDEDGVSNDLDMCDDRGDEGFGVMENGCPPHIVIPPDQRINWQYGDLSSVVYEHADGAAIYCWNGESAWLGLHVNQAMVDNAPQQAQNVPVAEYNQDGCRTAFYILDNGEYQINIWTWDGKLYEIIADNIQFQGVTMRVVE